MRDQDEAAWQRVCPSEALLEGGDAVAFDVRYQGLDCRAFVVRFHGQVHAYLNRCSHVPMEMDWQANRFFDDTGQWLLCATHGAAYSPSDGACVGGPCRGGLIKVPVRERDGAIAWCVTDPFSRACV